MDEAHVSDVYEMLEQRQHGEPVSFPEYLQTLELCLAENAILETAIVTRVP